MLRRHVPTLLVLLIVLPLPQAAQDLYLNYTLRVNTGDLSRVEISLELANVPHVLKLAMATHFLNKHNNSHSIEDIQVEDGTLEHPEEALWRLTVPGKHAVVRCKVRIGKSVGMADAAQPFLTPSGGLLGDLHMFLYPVEASQAPAHVALQLPSGWKVATALAPTSEEHVFYAGNAEELLDSPILAGDLREWQFQVDGVPVLVAYWHLPNAKSFDEKAWIGGIEKIVRAGAAVFGHLPGREYVFQIRDGARGGLEHRDSVTLGMPSERLAANAHAIESTTAHEFFHLWNMMRIHSVEYRLDYRPLSLSGLWFSEGATMFYADLLLRRAGLPTEEPTRIAHLERLIMRYQNEEHGRLSAEQLSLNAFDPLRPAGGRGDFIGSPHLHGELISAMLDLAIREATSGGRSLDDLMRAMLAPSLRGRGFNGKDVEGLANDVCGCDLNSLFETYVWGVEPIDFNRYLEPAGLRMQTEKRKEYDDGKPVDDRWVVIFMVPGETVPRLQLLGTKGAWGRAGVHTGDRLLKFNGLQITTAADLIKMIEPLHIGDTFGVEVQHDGVVRNGSATIAATEYSAVQIQALPNPTARQRVAYEAWNSGQ